MKITNKQLEEQKMKLPEDLEHEARYLCELRGQDPDGTVHVTPPPTQWGTIPAVVNMRPRWWVTAEELADELAKREAL